MRSLARGAPVAPVVMLLLLSFAAPVTADHGHEPEGPYMAVHEFRGIMACALGYHPVSTVDLCSEARRSAGLAVGPEYRHQFGFFMDAGLSTLVVALDAETPTHIPPWLKLVWQAPIDAIPDLRGQTPLLASYAFSPEMPFTQHAHHAALDVRPDSQAPTPQLLYETEIHICLGLFYNGEPVPGDYHPCP